jgi:hypothetical protein
VIHIGFRAGVFNRLAGGPSWRGREPGEGPRFHQVPHGTRRVSRQNTPQNRPSLCAARGQNGHICRFHPHVRDIFGFGVR